MSAACIAAMAAVIAEEEHRRNMELMGDEPIGDIAPWEFMGCFGIGAGLVVVTILIANFIMKL